MIEISEHWTRIFDFESTWCAQISRSDRKLGLLLKCMNPDGRMTYGLWLHREIKPWRWDDEQAARRVVRQYLDEGIIPVTMRKPHPTEETDD